MEEPNVKIEEIIRIGNKLIASKAKVIRVYNEEERESGVCGDIEVIYNQNGLKAVKDDLIWSGNEWKFKISGPSGVVYDLDNYPDIK